MLPDFLIQKIMLYNRSDEALLMRDPINHYYIHSKIFEYTNSECEPFSDYMLNNINALALFVWNL